MAEAGNQVTLVAYLERKPPRLARLIAACQGRLATALGDAFQPCHPRQIHATIVGLERLPGSRRDNANLARLRGLTRPMDVEGFVSAMRGDPDLPLRIRFGGFAPDERPFASRGRTPWERGFSIQGDKAVLIGWPVIAAEIEDYPPTLDRLRRRAGAFGILHAYHAAPTDVDNDLYLRLGTVRDAAIGAGILAGIEASLREVLASAPVTVPLAPGDLRLAVYRDPALPPHSTRALTLDAAGQPGVAEALFG